MARKKRFKPSDKNMHKYNVIDKGGQYPIYIRKDVGTYSTITFDGIVVNSNDEKINEGDVLNQNEEL